MRTIHPRDVHRIHPPVGLALYLLPVFFAWLCLGAAPVHADAACASRPDGSLCPPPADKQCLGPGRCKAGDCQDFDKLPAGTACGPPPDLCRLPFVCDGLGACDLTRRDRPDGTFCGGSDTPCTENRSCHAGTCQAGMPTGFGHICRISTDPCFNDSLCDLVGNCPLKGTLRPAGTVCAGSQICLGIGTCDAKGACFQPAIHEGEACVGNPDICQNGTCQSGACGNNGPRTCVSGDPCQQSSCKPGVGCVFKNICDMASPDLLVSLRDGGPSPADLAMPRSDGGPSPADLAMPRSDGGPSSGDLLMSLPDQGAVGQDLAMSLADQGAAGDASGAGDGPDRRQDGAQQGDDLAGSGDGGRRPGADDRTYSLPVEVTGGACACQVGRTEAPLHQALLLLGCALLLGARRRRRSKSQKGRP